MGESDMRVVRTKYAIRQAFYELLQEKDFNKITVREISDRAGINRVTFYLHYQDKYDFLDRLIDEVIEQSKMNVSLVTPELVYTCKEEGCPLPHVVNLLDYVEENKVLFRFLSKSDTGDMAYQRICSELHGEMELILRQLGASELLITYRYAIIPSLFGSIAKAWIQRGMVEPKEEIAALITNCIFAVLEIT